MTLSTMVYILDPVDPQEMIDFVNKHLLGAANPAFTCGPDEWDDDKEIVHYRNQIGQGFNALFWAYYRADGPLYAEDQYVHYEGEDPYLTAPACFMSMDFDTGYAFRDPKVGDCNDLHAGYIVALYNLLTPRGIRLRWRNEYTGEIFDGLDGLNDFALNGIEAQAWFQSVFPALMKHLTANPEEHPES